MAVASQLSLALKPGSKESKKSGGLLLYSPHMSVDDDTRETGTTMLGDNTPRVPVEDPDRKMDVSWINLKKRPSLPRAAQAQGINWEDVKFQKGTGTKEDLAIVGNATKLEVNPKRATLQQEESEYVPSVRPPTKVRIIPMPDECKSEKSKKQVFKGYVDDVGSTINTGSGIGMEITNEISAEQLPKRRSSSAGSDYASVTLPDDFQSLNIKNLSEDELSEKLEAILLEKVKQGDVLANFQLGQLYFEQEQYEDCRTFFQAAADKGDFQAQFQVGVLCYDGLGGKADHKKGFDYMLQIATSTSKRASHLVRAAQYNVGRAFFQGYGVQQSDSEAERFWLLSADDGNPKGSVKAQSTLGMFYSREESKDLKKAFFWHSEACGNASLESQGALGVMYLNGLGCKKNLDSAFACLRQASDRGNVFAMGNLISYYYRRKLYTKTVELSARVVQYDTVEEVAKDTDCLPGYICKGIAIGCFFYARCLHQGLGVAKSEDLAKKYYSKSYKFDPDICARLQNITQHGEI